MCMGVFFFCMYICAPYVFSMPTEDRKGHGSVETGVTYDCKPPCGSKYSQPIRDLYLRNDNILIRKG